MKEEEKKIQDSEEEILNSQDSEQVEGGAQAITNGPNQEDLENAGGIGCDCGC